MGTLRDDSVTKLAAAIEAEGRKSMTQGLTRRQAADDAMRGRFDERAAANCGLSARQAGAEIMAARAIAARQLNKP